MKTSKKGVKLTPEERQQVISAVRKVWDYIYCDAMDLLGQEGRKSYRRSEVAELCFDASRPVTIGGLDPGLAQSVIYMSETARRDLIREAFPHARYGM